MQSRLPPTDCQLSGFERAARADAQRITDISLLRPQWQMQLLNVANGDPCLSTLSTTWQT
jgi:hypothetical protein